MVVNNNQHPPTSDAKLNLKAYVLGWDLDQWARVLAIYHDEPATTLSQAKLIQRDYKLRNTCEPGAKPLLLGVKPDMDYKRARRLLWLGMGDG